MWCFRVYRLTILVIFLTWSHESSHCHGSFRKVLAKVPYLNRLTETCSDPWFTRNISAFRESIKQNVFGQPFVENVVANAVAGHFRNQPKKALTLSFHGWPGCGKNYVSSFLVKNIFYKGMESIFYKYYNARLHFPTAEKADEYMEKLRNEILLQLNICPHSVFVFDEVDMMPYKVLDVLHPFIDHHERIEGIDIRNAVYIFLSNKGGNAICEIYLEEWRIATKRKELKIFEFQNAIRLSAYNEKGGLKDSHNIDSHLITYFVPFLPLERSHVVSCIKAEFKALNFVPKPKHILEILEEVSVTPKGSASGGLFASSGCKGISSKVAAMIEKEKYLRDEL